MQSMQTSPKRIAASVAVAVISIGAPLAALADDDLVLDTGFKLSYSMSEPRTSAGPKFDAAIKISQNQLPDAPQGNSPFVAAVATASEAARSEMREQLKREILAEMKGQMAEDLKRELLADMKPQMAADLKRQVLAELTGAVGASQPATQASGAADPATAIATDKTKSRVVRVPYVPESMRREIREQVKQEVLAQAKEERWGNPGALPEWLDRFHFEGDVRLRSDSFRLGKTNTPAGSDNNNGLTTRGADLTLPYSGVGPLVNTQDDFNRTRLRLRFGATAKVADTVSAGFQFSTGSTSGPTSTNQTLGQGFNKYALVLDRGYITLNPTPWLSLTGGRIANPFFSTDLVWADDLNFEGVAAKFSQMLTPDLTAFATAGWFPLRTDNSLQTTSRDLQGVQAGINWRLTPTTDFKLGAAIYNYKGIEGQVEDSARYNFGLPVSDYGTRYEYPAGLRQRGNTLFLVNAQGDNTVQNFWGLASKFRELNLTGSLDIARFDPVHVVLTGDYVRNLAFDRKTIEQVTGSPITDGKNTGYLGKITVGHPTMTRWGDWNVSLAYRWLGSDAVLDAFTNSDFGMGGTNNKGYILGANWGIDKNAWLSTRWMSSQLIDSMAPQLAGTTIAPTKLSVDLLQVDLNARF
jgi:hypothetical protein